MKEELKVIISAEIEKLQSGVNEAQGIVKTFKSELDKNGVDIKGAWNTMGEGVVNASKKIVGGVAGIATALVGVSATTEEYRNNQAKLNTAFETAGASAETAKDVYNDLYRVLGDDGQTTEAAAHLAQLTTEQKALEEWTTICQGVYATFGDSLPIEGLTEAANETAKVGQVTGGLADALNWAGISEDEFNEKLAECNTEAEREKLIREALIGVYDEAAQSYEANNEAVLAQNEAQAELQSTLADIGEAIAPVVTLFTSLATDALAVVTPYIQELADKYMPTLKDTLEKVGEFLTPIIEFLVNHLPTIATIAGIILGIAAAYTVINGAITAYNAVKTAFTTITGIATAAQTAFAAANTAALAPILAVVAAIAAVIAIIVLVVKHWDEIKEKVAEVVEKIKIKVEEMKEKIATKFEEIKQNMRDKIDEAKKKVTDTIENLKTAMATKIDNIKSSVKTKFEEVKEKILSPIEKARDKVKEIIDKIKGFFSFTIKMPHIPMPHFSITPQGWSVGDLLQGSIPKLGISWYAHGGVFDKPTLFGYGNGMLGGLGENGAEAVVPLENNLEWLDKLATMLGEKIGADKPVVLNVDGKVFAETSIRSINNLTKQTGTLPLIIV